MLNNVLKLTVGLLLAFVAGNILFRDNVVNTATTAATLFLLWFSYTISELLLLKYNAVTHKSMQDKLNRKSIAELQIKDDSNVEYNDDILYMWKTILSTWQKRRTNYKRPASCCRALGYYIFFTLFTSLLVYVSTLIASQSNIEFKFTVASLWSPLTIILLTVTILEFAIFLWAMSETQWPRQNVTIQTTDRVCLLIACHESCYTREKTVQFEETLRSALQIFEPPSIFVCDNGNSLFPVDLTQKVCQRIHADINYVYIPEGNKTHAMYWVSEYWIPHLQRWGIVGTFDYALMIDDDVWLPKDIDLGVSELDQNSSIGGYGYAITADSASESQNTLVALQDIEYKLSGFFKTHQSAFHSISWAHGAISLWRREMLGNKILYDHDTVFHGEDMYMGVLMQRGYPQMHLKYLAATPVKTFAPNNLLTLFRQRVRSWDLCNQRKMFTFVRLLFQQDKIYLKPFYFLEIVNILFDWLRPFIITNGLVYYGFPAVLSVGMYLVITYTMLLLFKYYALRNRPDLAQGTGAILLYPIYKFFIGVFRIIALMHNAVWYTPLHPVQAPIQAREETFKTIPPVPPFPKPNWQQVYTDPQYIQPSKTLLAIRSQFKTRGLVNLDLFFLVYVEITRLQLFVEDATIKSKIKQYLKPRQVRLFYNKLESIEEALQKHAIQEGTNNLRVTLEQIVLMEPIIVKTNDDNKRWARLLIRHFNNACFYMWQIHSPYSHDKLLQIKQLLVDKELILSNIHKFLVPGEKVYTSRDLMRVYANTLRRSSVDMPARAIVSDTVIRRSSDSLITRKSRQSIGTMTEMSDLESFSDDSILDRRVQQLCHGPGNNSDSDSDGFYQLHEAVYDLEDMLEEITERSEHSSRKDILDSPAVRKSINKVLFS